jgi:lipopolysaccharide/colanic/teichoic acid biosynthesis glycosyltransferase
MVRDTRALKSPQALPSRRELGYPFVKRVLDVAICLMMLPLLAVVMAAIALAIFLNTGRPIFFVQERVGQNGRRFRMLKFRTLRVDFNDRAAREFMKAFVHGEIGRDNDSGRRMNKPIEKTQITSVGRLLRKTSLDELPQILNVLRGEMSLIGPRPNVPWEVEAYHDWHNARLQALPGITGLAQVRGRSCISFDDIVLSDIEYIEKQSLKLDLKILWWTVASVLCGRGAG